VSRRYQMGDARSQDASFADAGACENENGALQRLHSAALLLIQPVEIGRIGPRRSARERPSRRSGV
jgi:hypothetical protein